MEKNLPNYQPHIYIYILYIYIYICIIRVAPHTGTRGVIWVIPKGERYNDPIPPIQRRPDLLCWSSPEDALAVERWRRQDTSSSAMAPRAAWPICPQLFSLTVIAAKVSDGNIQKGTHIIWKTQSSNMASWEIHESPVKGLKGTSSANEVTLPATSPRHLPVLWPQHLGMNGLFIGIRMALVSFSCIYSGGHVTLFFTCFKRCFSWCWTFQEKVKSVASRACCKFQEKAKSVASRAYLELQDPTSELSIPNVASKEPGARCRY